MGWFTSDAVVIMPDDECLDYEVIEVSTDVVGLTVGKLISSDNRLSTAAAIMAEDADVRYRLDGTNPTSTTGFLLTYNSVPLIVRGHINLRRIKFVRATSTDAKVHVHYYYGQSMG